MPLAGGMNEKPPGGAESWSCRRNINRRSSPTARVAQGIRRRVKVRSNRVRGSFSMDEKSSKVRAGTNSSPVTGGKRMRSSGPRCLERTARSNSSKESVSIAPPGRSKSINRLLASERGADGTLGQHGGVVGETGCSPGPILVLGGDRFGRFVQGAAG